MSGAPQPIDNSLSLFNGRHFCSFGLQHRIHCVPVDEVRRQSPSRTISDRVEVQRQERRYDEVNDVLKQLLGRVILPSGFRLDNVEDPEVLECGYGKGAWIDDLLKENDQLDIEVSPFPHARTPPYSKNHALTEISLQVIGIDIFTGQGNNGDDDNDSPEDSDSEEEGIEEYIKTRFNMNAPFREERTGVLRPEKFHLINSRLLADGINASRWATYVKDLKAVLCPGGWLQMVEIHPLFQS